MVPPIVTQVAAETTKTQRGVVSARYERMFHVHAGPMSRTDELVFIGVYEDGKIVAMRIISDTIGKKPASSAQRAKDQAKYVHPGPTDVFHAPWDARYLGEYTYRVVNPTTIAFTSQVKDTAHGSGTFTIDQSTDVVSYQYSMSANYKYVKSSTITGTRSQALPGYWAMVHEVQEYSGHYGIFSGGATTEITQSAFHKYGSLNEAESALKASNVGGR